MQIELIISGEPEGEGVSEPLITGTCQAAQRSSTSRADGTVLGVDSNPPKTATLSLDSLKTPDWRTATATSMSRQTSRLTRRDRTEAA